MRSFIISSALFFVVAYCGYPVAENTYPTPPSSYPTTPSYPLPKKYPVAPTYPVKPSYPSAPTYSAPPPPPPPNPSGYTSNSFSDSEVAPQYAPAATTYSGNAIDYNSSSSSSFKGRAKARTSHNRQFKRRSLQPIRRFQQKKQ